MTIIFPDKFRSSLPAAFDGIFDWDFLLPVFSGTKIQPMDIDAVVERKGKILVFETKDPSVEVPQGQAITLQRLILCGRGQIYVMILYGKTHNSIVGMEEWYFSRRRKNVVKLPKIKCDFNHVYLRVKKWWEWANK